MAASRTSSTSSPSAAQGGFGLLDLEIESAEAISSSELDQLRASGAALIVSVHDFAATGDLREMLARIARLQPDLAKIIPTAQSLSDNLAVFHLLQHHHGDLPIVTMGMGEQGLISRVLGPRFGSAFTFASTARGEESAPGQVTARTLLDLYRLDHITTETSVYGVAGTHVQSSLSPIMHNAAFAQQAIDAVYLPLQTTAISDLVRLVRELPLNGLSVTMPFKQQILPFLDRIDPLAARIGAVNTVHRTPDGKLHGSNTDVAGITAPLEQRLSLRGARVLLLGAGGELHAPAAFALCDKGAHVSILNRTSQTAHALAAECGATVFERTKLTQERFDVLVNATPLGMSGFSQGAPMFPEELRASFVFDLVYNPLDTPLLALARPARDSNNHRLGDVHRAGREAVRTMDRNRSA